MNIRNSRVYTAPVPKMPPGLVELMEGLARDVLKNSPTDVYAFCADHMQKLLQIRNGSTAKKRFNLEQKIEVATKKIQERAAQRCEEFDRKHNLLNAVENSIKYEENYVEAKQYNQENIVKIPDNVLLDNTEHEIIIGGDKSMEPIIETVLTDLTSDEIEISCSKNDSIITNETESGTTDIEISKNAEDTKTINNDDIICNNEITPEIINSIKEENMSQSVNNGKDICDVNLVLEQKDKSDNMVSQTISTDKKSEEILGEEDLETRGNNINFEDGFKVSNETLITNSEMIQTIVTDTEEQNNENNVTYEGENVNSEPKGEEKMQCKSQSNFNNNSMDLETAAITIQKVFRSFLFRNKTSSIDDPTNVDLNLLIEEKENKENDAIANSNINKDRRGISRMDTVLQTVNEEKSLSLSDDSSTLSSAATIIQAHVRGFLARNKLNVNKTISSTSGIDSDAQSLTSFEGDNDYRKNKTVLNIHIVPEGGHFMSRDESILTSTDLSLDGSPPGSTSLHPLGYDINVRRKQLKREDAIQSVSPPSNNSGKLSEDVDSVKEMPLNGDNENKSNESHTISKVSTTINTLNDDNIATMMNDDVKKHNRNIDSDILSKPNELKKMASDEMDVITPFEALEESETPENNVKLIHSGECHDMVLPTKVSRNDTSIVRGE